MDTGKAGFRLAGSWLDDLSSEFSVQYSHEFFIVPPNHLIYVLIFYFEFESWHNFTLAQRFVGLIFRHTHEYYQSFVRIQHKFFVKTWS